MAVVFSFKSSFSSKKPYMSHRNRRIIIFFLEYAEKEDNKSKTEGTSSKMAD